MTISLRLSDEDTKLIKDYAKINNMSVSDLIRKAVIEKIEDEIDLDAYNKAIKEFKKNSKTYTLDEIEKELGL
ncbi:MAG: CopG family transcriptional regulator [Solobacterium sp.]|nr:CopG family transcriptional regulator [Solobacterium sp.]